MQCLFLQRENLNVVLLQPMMHLFVTVQNVHLSFHNQLILFDSPF